MTKDDAKDHLLSQLEFINELIMDHQRNEAMYVYSLDSIERLRHNDYGTIREYLDTIRSIVSEKEHEIRIASRLLVVAETGDESVLYGYST